MINKYPGTCGTCSTPVGVGEGIVIKILGKWKTYCTQCDAPDRKESKPIDDSYMAAGLVQRVKERLETLMTGTDSTRRVLATELYEEFFGTIIPEDEIPF